MTHPWELPDTGKPLPPRSGLSGLVWAVALLILILLLNAAYGFEVGLRWNPNPPAENVTEYRIYHLKGDSRVLLASTAATSVRVETEIGWPLAVVAVSDGVESAPSAPVTSFGKLKATIQTSTDLKMWVPVEQLKQPGTRFFRVKLELP